jgi:paraquat-inducible protein B
MSTPSTPQKDHGVVVPSKRLQISWVWLFPVMAASAAGYMFANEWLSRGPVIHIEFPNAPGIRAGKTALIYRGVVAGEVDRVELDSKLEKVEVRVRLKKFAEGIARQGSTFWIDQPVLSLSGASGIDSLINGNSIQASMGTGPYSTSFIGSENPPVVSPNKVHDLIRLRGSIASFLDAGTPVYFRGVAVGVVKSKGLDSNRAPYLDVLIDEQYEDLLRVNARFWVVHPTDVKIGSGVFKIDFSGLKTLLFGAINFDFFGEEGDKIGPSAEFQLYGNASAAKATSAPITLEFTSGQGLLPGETQLRYMGVPVGMVEKVTAAEGKVLVVARLQPGYEMLRRKGSLFSILRPTISLQKVSGLETLVSGIYIDCIPGPKGPEGTRFNGISQEDAALVNFQDQGFDVVLSATSSKIGVDTPVIYRGVQVGKITRKDLAPGGGGVQLTASVKYRYASLLRENSRFWNAGGVKISGGLINLNVQSSVLESKGLGGVEFSTPSGDAAGAPVKEGYRYDLYDAPKKEWLDWIPSIPLPKSNN